MFAPSKRFLIFNNIKKTNKKSMKIGAVLEDYQLKGFIDATNGWKKTILLKIIEIKVTKVGVVIWPLVKVLKWSLDTIIQTCPLLVRDEVCTTNRVIHWDAFYHRFEIFFWSSWVTKMFYGDMILDASGNFSKAASEVRFRINVLT